MITIIENIQSIHRQIRQRGLKKVHRIKLPYCQVNTLSREVLGEFEEILGKIQSDPVVKSAVLVSGKPDCFIAGADIT